MQTTQRSQTLSTFMKISIGILAVVTLASISLLFIGDFAGKFERVFSTMVLFAIFVLLTAFDTRKEQRNEWYAPVALIANAYILGLLLIVIWVTPYSQFSLGFTIFWKSVFVLITTRVVTFGLEKLLEIGENKPEALGKWGQVTGILGVLTLIMFTAPVGIEAFRVNVPELYWKFAVAALILTALGLAITLLLNWYYRTPAERMPVNNYVGPEQQYAADASYASSVNPPGVPMAPGTDPYTPGQAPFAAVDYYADQATADQATADRAPSDLNPSASLEADQQGVPTATVEPAAAGVPTATVVSETTAEPEEELLPWPTFADGTPYPQLPNGQPDFSAADKA